MPHLEVNNSANINDIILCFSGLIENRITFHLIKKVTWSIGEKTFCVILYLETKSLKTVQERHHGSFNFHNFPHKFQITCWVKQFKGTGTLIKSTKKVQKSTSGRKLTARSPENVDTVRDSVGRSPKSHSGDALKSLVFLVQPFTESWRMAFSCTHTESRSNKLSHNMTWQNVLRCVRGSKARFKKIQIFFKMSGSVMNPTSLYQAMSKERTLCSGDLKHQMT